MPGGSNAELKAELEPHGSGGGGGKRVEGYFSSIERERGDDGHAEGAEEINPILKHKAREQRKSELQRPALETAGKYRTGGLARLDDGPRPERSEEEEVNRYLSRHEKVKTHVRHSQAEVCAPHATRGVEVRCAIGGFALVTTALECGASP